MPSITLVITGRMWHHLTVSAAFTGGAKCRCPSSTWFCWVRCKRRLGNWLPFCSLQNRAPAAVLCEHTHTHTHTSSAFWPFDFDSFCMESPQSHCYITIQWIRSWFAALLRGGEKEKGRMMQNKDKTRRIVYHCHNYITRLLSMNNGLYS